MSNSNKAADILVEQGMKLYREGKMEEALMYWRKALELQPLHPKASKYIQEAGPSVSAEALIEETTTRIDSNTLKKQIDASRPRPVMERVEQPGTVQEFADESTEPISKDVLEKQLAQSWVNSPADDLEITISPQGGEKDTRATSTTLKPIPDPPTAPAPVRADPPPVLEFVVGEPEDTIGLDEYQDKRPTPDAVPVEDDFTITVMEEETAGQRPDRSAAEEDDFTITIDDEEV